MAILEGFESQNALEEKFESKDGMALEQWFNKSTQKHMNVIGWWFEL